MGVLLTFFVGMAHAYTFPAPVVQSASAPRLSAPWTGMPLRAAKMSPLRAASPPKMSLLPAMPVPLLRPLSRTLAEPEVEIRGVTRGDAFAIAELCTDCFYGAHTFADGPVIFLQRSQLLLRVYRQILRRIGIEEGRECKFLVACDPTGAICGCADLGVHLFDRTSGRFELAMDVMPGGENDRWSWRPYCASLAVRKQDRRKGIARRLLRAAEKTCRGWGYRSLMLEVACTNLGALSFYKATGYRVTTSDRSGTGATEVEVRGGVWHVVPVEKYLLRKTI